MMDVTSSASVHCRLFLRRTYPLVLQRGHTGSSAGRIAVQQEHERSSSKLSYKLQRELEQLPQLLEDLEAKLEALQTQVADASFFSQPHEQTQKVLADMAAAEQELEQAFERWEYLEALKNGG